MSEEILLYIAIQLVQSLKAMYFSKLRQQGKTEEEVRAAWRELWEPFKMIDPEQELKPVPE